MVLPNYFCLGIVVCCHLRDFQSVDLHGICQSQVFFLWASFFCLVFLLLSLFFFKGIGEGGSSFVGFFFLWDIIGNYDALIE